VNKTVTPKQLELTAGKTREELILATAPNIDPESPAFKASVEKIKKIEIAEAATAVLAAAAHPQEFDDFDWHADPSVVLKSQPATAIYYNPAGCIVIRQERSWAEESDPYVYITPENAVTFMEALAKRARE
jgi:ABC-type Zn uptake system ZnuABC Zn-binding protein ZnuA